MMRTIDYACHTAHLCPMTGEGVLVLPLFKDDMAALGSGGQSLHESGWNAVVAHLEIQGWTLSEDDDGGSMTVGHTEDGREVLGLYGSSPVVTIPTIAEQATAFAVLSELATIRPRAGHL